MTWTYTVKGVQDNTGFPNGEYEARCIMAKRVIGRQTNFLELTWKMLSPKEVEGETFVDRFYIESDNDTTRKIAERGFEELCQQMQLKVGETLTEEDLFNKLLDRFAILTIRNTDKNGTVYTNIIKRQIIEYPTTYRMKAKENQQPAPDKGVIDDLNDEVPSFL